MEIISILCNMLEIQSWHRFSYSRKASGRQLEQNVCRRAAQKPSASSLLGRRPIEEWLYPPDGLQAAPRLLQPFLCAACCDVGPPHRSEAVGFFAVGASPHRGMAVSAGWSASSPPRLLQPFLCAACACSKYSLIFLGFWFTIEVRQGFFMTAMRVSQFFSIGKSAVRRI